MTSLKNIQQHINDKDFTSAKSSLEEIIKIDPKNVQLLDLLSFVCLKLDLIDQAEHFLEKALQITPNSPLLLAHLGVAYLKNKNFYDAEIAFKKSLAGDRDNVETMCHLSTTLSCQEKKEEAVACLMAILDVDAHHLRTRYLLGKLLCEEKYYNEADKHFELIVSLSPDTLTNIIKIYLDTNQFQLAKKYAERLLEHHPADTELLYNLGVIESKLNLPLSASHYYQILLKFKPDHFPSLNNLGVIYLEQQNISAATHFFERAHALQPNDEPLRYTLNALSGKQNYTKAPQKHVKELFDQYADHFEDHLRHDLNYQTPEKLLALYHQYINRNGVDILDLGCGTGLCGALFKPFAKTLIGIDLSTKMLDLAKQKNCYDDVFEFEIIDYLKSTKQTFDLIFAADVLPYFGDLTDFMSLCRQRLKPNGTLLFSAEICFLKNFQLQKTGRFSHATPYIEKLVSKHFEIICKKQTNVRTQKQQAVENSLFLLLLRNDQNESLATMSL